MAICLPVVACIFVKYGTASFGLCVKFLPAFIYIVVIYTSVIICSAFHSGNGNSGFDTENPHPWVVQRERSHHLCIYRLKRISALVDLPQCLLFIDVALQHLYGRCTKWYSPGVSYMPLRIVGPGVSLFGLRMNNFASACNRVNLRFIWICSAFGWIGFCLWVCAYVHSVFIGLLSEIK